MVYLTFRKRITDEMSEISDPKTRSMESVDDLGGSFEVLHFPEGILTFFFHFVFSRLRCSE